MSKKELYIKEIKDNQQVDDFFLIKEVSRAETRGGKPYLIVTVMDNTGELGGRLWEDADHYLPICRPGAIVLLKGQAQTYKNVLQLRIDAIQAVTEKPGKAGLNRGDFLPATTGDIPAMATELLSFVNSIRDGHLKNLLLEFFRPGEFFTAFKKAPAAKRMHHAYYGGLLEHTLTVTRLADMLAGLYPVIDRSLLIAGALLHDIGKIKEFSYDSYPFDYTDKGRLLGHLVIGVEMIQTHIAQQKNFPAELATRLQHLILSHHGRHEFGSPCLPMTMEAFVLNFIDDMDAKINFLDRLSNQVSEPGYQWTDFQKTLERFLYVRGGPLLEMEEIALSSPKPKEQNNPQQTLF